MRHHAPRRGRDRLILTDLHSILTLLASETASRRVVPLCRLPERTASQRKRHAERHDGRLQYNDCGFTAPPCRRIDPTCHQQMRFLACVPIALSTRWPRPLFAVAAIVFAVILRPAPNVNVSAESRRSDDSEGNPHVRAEFPTAKAAAPSLRGGVELDQLRSRSRSPSCAARSCCSISGRFAASIATTSCPTWRSSKRNTRTSWSSSASIPPSSTPSATPRTSAARSREYRIKHPVVNDAKHDIWNRFGVNSWPTLVLIDAKGDSRGLDPAAKDITTCSTARSASSSRKHKAKR